MVKRLGTIAARIGYDGLGFCAVAVGVGAYDWRLGLIVSGVVLMASAIVGTVLTRRPKS